MKITVVGRGNIGGGLGKRWEAAGHEVKTFGRDGGDGSDADVVVVAVPSGSVADALGKVTGIEGKPTIDTINAFHGRNEQYESLTHEVKSIVAGRRRRRSTSTSPPSSTKSMQRRRGRATSTSPRKACVS